MLVRLRQLAAPPVFADPAKTRNAALLNTVLLSAIVILAPTGLGQLAVTAPEQRWRVGLYGLLIGLALVSRWFVFQGRLRAASWLVTTGLWVGFQFAALSGGGVRGISFIGSVFVIMLANPLLGGPATALFLILSVASGAALAYLSSAQIIPPPFQSDWLLWLQFSALFGMCALLFHVVLRSMLQAASRADRELTWRQRAEAQLDATQANYRSLIETLPIIAFRFAVAEMDRPTYISPQVESLLGYKAEDWTSTPNFWLACVHEDDRPRVLSVLEQTGVTGQGSEVEFRIVARGGQVRWFQSRFILIAEGRQKAHVDGFALDITERRQAEEALRESEERYRLLFESSEEAILLTQPDGSIFSANPAACRIFGRSEDEIKKLDRAGIVDPDDPRLQGLLEERERTGQFKGELNHIRKGGAIFPAEVSSKVFKDSRGNVKRSLFIRDITERKQAEEALRQSEERFALAAQASNEGLWDRNLIVNRTYVSPRWETMLGYKEGAYDSERDNFEDLIHPGDKALARRTEKAFLKGEIGQYRLEFRLRHTDGSYRWIRSHAVAVRDAAGRPIRLVGAHQDITEQKLAEESVRQSSLKYRALFESAADAIFVIRDGLYVDCNSQSLSMFGCERSQVLGQSPARFSSVMQPSGRSSTLQLAEKFGLALAGASQTFEWRHMRHDGASFDAEVRLTRVDLDNDPHLLALVRDVSERKLAQTRLMEAEARYRLLVEQVPAITYVIGYGPDAPASYVSPQIESVLGFTPAEWLADPEIWERQLHPDDRDRVRAEEARNLGHDSFTAEYRIFARDGREVWLHDESRRVFDEHGQYQYAQGIQYDITERKRAEAAAQRYAAELERAVAERTADLSRVNAELEQAGRAKDEFLASMSHELRTPLNAILALTESLEEGTYGALSDRQAKPLRTVSESGLHLLDLINDLLDLAKIEAGKMELQIERVEIEAVCEASLRLVRQQAGQKQQRLSVGLDKSAGILRADPRALKQILVNLLSNAVKFTPAGGQIGLETQADAAHGAIRFVVWDTGIGISPKDSARLFQPFVQLDTSLARQYGGTGLGLALVHRLTELHGGSVSLTSAPGEGSRFIVALPWELNARAAPPATPEVPKAPQIISALVIEDTPAIADQLARYLGETGAQVTVCSAGEAALSQAIDLQPQVIILDILLPDVSGWEILARLKAEPRTRSIPVIAVTALNDRAHGLGAAEYLVKPVSRLRLAEALNRALARATPADADGHKPEASQPLVLLAEDNPDNQTVYVDYLAARGFRVILAVNGQEAVARARAERPDLILMDVQMPVMDGLEATRQIRADAALSQLPIIAVTGLAMPGDGERCLAAGANDYLTKPVGLKHLLNVIQAHLPQKPND